MTPIDAFGYALTGALFAIAFYLLFLAIDDLRPVENEL